MKKVYYRSPEKSVCADVIPFYDKGEFKLFYLRDFRDVEKHGEGCPWCLLEGKDLVSLKDNGPVLLRGTAEEQDLYVFTGSIIKHGDIYTIYYTGHNPHLRAQGFPEQKILRANSKDLIHWEKDRDFVFAAPDYLEMHDFRDPFVYFDETKGIYRMLIAARDKNDKPYWSKGLTLVAESKDLDKWTLLKEPFYYPHSYFTHECPDLFKIGDWWYLLFSEFTDKISTTYRMAKTPEGPWITPENNTFDGHAFYAAKSVSDGNRRILFGWNPIKNNEVDFDWWQWGGNVIPHEIIQNSDGTLAVKCPKEIYEAFDKEITLEEKENLGEVTKEGDTYILGKEGHNLQMFQKSSDTFMMECEFEIEDKRGDFGIILRGFNTLERFYKVKFEPRMNRLAMDSLPRKDGNLHAQIDTERYLPLEVGKKNKVTVIVQESVLEVYVNDQVAMSGRMFDTKEGQIGIYSNYASVKFSNIKVKE